MTDPFKHDIARKLRSEAQALRAMADDPVTSEADRTAALAQARSLDDQEGTWDSQAADEDAAVDTL
jgi:hypothetical protein